LVLLIDDWITDIIKDAFSIITISFGFLLSWRSFKLCNYRNPIWNIFIKSQSWWVYMIEASDSSLYTGITTDVERRWLEHCHLAGETFKGAKYFRGRSPRRLVFVDTVSDRSLASKYETRIKSMSRKEKLIFVQSSANRIHENRFDLEVLDNGS
jgi:putative endonuclease